MIKMRPGSFVAGFVASIFVLLGETQAQNASALPGFTIRMPKECLRVQATSMSLAWECGRNTQWAAVIVTISSAPEDLAVIRQRAIGKGQKVSSLVFKNNPAIDIEGSDSNPNERTVQRIFDRYGYQYIITAGANRSTRRDKYFSMVMTGFR
jgi:hypothetical protein